MNKYDKIIGLYLESINLFSDVEKTPRQYGTSELLYNSEIDTLVLIGDYQPINLTQLAKQLGISKSGTSRFVKKLVDKHLIIKEKKEGNEKEVLFRLTEEGAIAYKEKTRLDKEIYSALYQNVKRYVDDDLNRIEDFLSETNREIKKLRP